MHRQARNIGACGQTLQESAKGARFGREQAADDMHDLRERGSDKIGPLQGCSHNPDCLRRWRDGCEDAPDGDDVIQM